MVIWNMQFWNPSELSLLCAIPRKAAKNVGFLPSPGASILGAEWVFLVSLYSLHSFDQQKSSPMLSHKLVEHCTI